MKQRNMSGLAQLSTSFCSSDVPANVSPVDSRRVQLTSSATAADSVRVARFHAAGYQDNRNLPGGLGVQCTSDG